MEKKKVWGNNIFQMESNSLATILMTLKMDLESFSSIKVVTFKVNSKRIKLKDKEFRKQLTINMMGPGLNLK